MTKTDVLNPFSHTENGMNYLACMVLLTVVIAIFLRILAVFERGNWPSENVSTLQAAVRELFWGRRTTTK